MLTKVIWCLIGLNAAALVILFLYFLADSQDRNVDSIESGWTVIIFSLGVVIILLAAVPLYMGKSSFSIYFAGFFAALPWVVGLWILISNNLPSFKKQETMAELYYKDKTQRAIASAIEKGDTVLFQQLIQGQDLNIQGNRVWDWDGLNYLQFAIRLRGSYDSLFNERANAEIIKLLIKKGSATTPALAEATKNLPIELVRLLLAAGADPNTHGFVNSDPLLFSAIGQKKEENDIAILLIQKGADVNRKNRSELTPLMFAANNASTGTGWKDTWRVVRYLLVDAHADYEYTLADGNNFTRIIDSIAQKAAQEKVTMPSDFVAVTEWLKKNPKNPTKN